MSQRSALNRSMWANLRNLVVILITFSAAGTALFAQATLQVVAGATVFGFVIAVLLVVIAFPGSTNERAMRASEYDWGE